MTPCCFFCRKDVDPSQRSLYRRVIAWERKALGDTRRSGSDVVMRQQLDEVAHPHCVERARLGLTGQDSLLS